MTLFNLLILALVCIRAPGLRQGGGRAFWALLVLLALVALTNAMAQLGVLQMLLAPWPSVFLRVVREEFLRFAVIFLFTRALGVRRRLVFAFMFGLLIALYESVYYYSDYVDGFLFAASPGFGDKALILMTLLGGELVRAAFHIAISVGYGLAITTRRYWGLPFILLIHWLQNAHAVPVIDAGALDHAALMRLWVSILAAYGLAHLVLFGARIKQPVRMVRCLFATGPGKNSL